MSKIFAIAQIVLVLFATIIGLVEHSDQDGRAKKAQALDLIDQLVAALPLEGLVKTLVTSLVPAFAPFAIDMLVAHGNAAGALAAKKS